jgi:hypothetical protein
MVAYVVYLTDTYGDVAGGTVSSIAPLAADGLERQSCIRPAVSRHS